MHSRRSGFGLSLCLIAAFALACKFNFSTANLSELKIGKNNDVTTEASSFGPIDTVYGKATVSNAPGKTKVKIRLLIDNLVDKIEGFKSGDLVPGMELTKELPGSGSVTFNFSPPSAGWPAGSYKVETTMMNEDGEKKDEKTATFNVTGGARRAAPAGGDNAPSEGGEAENENSDSSGNQ